MSDIFEEPPDDNEAYESLDESLDAEDALGDGPEGERELDRDLIVDQEELGELGADLDDPERLSVLEGAMDDPDGSGPLPFSSASARQDGWDVDPVSTEQGTTTSGPDGTPSEDEPTDAELGLDVTEIEPWEMDEVADDTPKG